MEEPTSGHREMNEMTPQHTSKRPKGGLITMPFIIANESFERVSSYGLLPNMIIYLMTNYGMGVAKGANVLNLWNAASNFLPILGAFISDSYLGRFLTICLGSLSSLTGMIMLWLTAMIPQMRPPACDITSQICDSPKAGQLALLYSSFALISIGAGGIRPCSMAFGANQLDNEANPKNERVLESYFGWYYASATTSVLIALTGIVYIQDHLGWKIGFGVPALLMFLSAFLFVVASRLYVKQKPTKSLFTSFAQVIVAAFRNRNVPYPPEDSHGMYHHEKNSKAVAPTNRLRFLNKACIIRNPEQDIAPDGTASYPWSLCTIDQVEELKALIRVIPIWSTGIVISINVNQTTFFLIQANTLDRHMTSNFQIPAGSFGTFTLISLITWVILYDRAILPLASKIKGKPVKIGVKFRMGAGLLVSCMAVVVSAIFESIRRRKAIQEGYLNNPRAVMNMSGMWLIPQYCLHGIAEALNAIGQTEFYYSEFPKSMSSIATALFGLGSAVANLLATVIVSAVNDLTSRNGRESWLSNNINKGHYDYYYWLLATLSSINVLYYIFCSWLYGPCVDQVAKIKDEGNGYEDDPAEMTNLGTLALSPKHN